MNGLYSLSKRNTNIHLYLPESFEWIILKSGLLTEKEIQQILDTPEEYIDSKDYFSWERYFTRLLIDKTQGSYLQYRKSKLNESYLHEKSKKAILETMQGIAI